MSTDYPSDWDTRRKDVYQRDGYQCQNCGRDGGPHGSAELHAHHIVPKSKGGTHQRSNLVTVCKDCHNAIHGDSSAPTSNRTPQGKEFALAVVKNISNIANSDEASNEAVNRLYELFSKAGEGKQFMTDEYETIRYEIIKHAFNTKESIETYQSQIRPHLSHDAQTDIDSYVEATWDSIQAKVSVTGHSDDLLMEFANREIKCAECGEVVNPDAKFCKHCGDEIELIPECESCGNELDPQSNFCSQCGTEVVGEIETDEQLPVDRNAVEEHAEEMVKEIEDTVEKTLLVQILEKKFKLVWMEDYDPVWQYCPNCGLERGVLAKHRNAQCVLCGGEWKKKGILNTHWEGIEVSDMDLPNAENDITIRWEIRGKEKHQDKVYLKHLEKLDNGVS